MQYAIFAAFMAAFFFYAHYFLKSVDKPIYNKQGFKSEAEKQSFERRCRWAIESAKSAYTKSEIWHINSQFDKFIYDEFEPRKSVYIDKRICEVLAVINEAHTMIHNKMDWHSVVLERDEKLITNGAILKLGVHY